MTLFQLGWGCGFFLLPQRPYCAFSCRRRELSTKGLRLGTSLHQDPLEMAGWAKNPE